MNPVTLPACVCAALVLPALVVNAQMPGTSPTADETLVSTMHAQGAQVYECKADAVGKLVWQFREPIATLIADSKTHGRHYAGPNWELADSSAVVAKVVERAPAASPQDIPILKLEVVSQRGSGLLTGVTTIIRFNTKGGVADGSCRTAGALFSAPYSADYAFYRRARWSLIPEAARHTEPIAEARN